MYGFHRIYGWLLFAGLFGGVAVQVEANVTYSADDVDITFVGDDCPQNARQVHLSGTVYVSNDGFSYFFWANINQNASSYGTSGIMDIGNPNIFVHASYSVSPVGGDGAEPDNKEEFGQPGSPPQMPPVNSTVHYASVVPNPCGTGLDISGYQLNFTNNFASPLQLQNGDTLMPGQGTNVMFYFPEGANTNFGGSTINPQSGGYLPDSGGFTNSINLGQITNNLQPPVGGSANDYANGQGGPIVWDNTNSSQVDEAGFNALDETMLQNENAINNGLSNLYSQLHSNGMPMNLNLGTNIFNGDSNVWVENWPSNNFTGSTNVGGGASNVWVENWPFGTNESVSNAISYMLGQTNQAYTVLNPIASAQSTFVGDMPSSLGDQQGAAEEQDIHIGPGAAPITIAMGVLPANVASPFASLRSMIAWIIVVVLFCWNFDTLFDAMQEVLKTPQAQGPDTGAVVSSFFGNVFTAGFCALAIISLVSILPTVAAGLLAGELAFFGGSTTSNPLSFFNVMGWAYQFLSQFIPIYTLVTALGTRIVYWFAVRSLQVTLSAVIKTLLGM
jgi:hypothetical protein